jgi:hypothetical protein
MQARKGPDGTLNGAVRALLAANGPWVCGPSTLAGLTPGDRRAAQKWNEVQQADFKERRARLATILKAIERDEGRKAQNQVVMALWRAVQKLLDHRSTMALKQTARAEAALAKRTNPVKALSQLEEIRVRYWLFDPIREPIEHAIEGLRRLQRLPGDVQRQILGAVVFDGPPRLEKRGNPYLKRLNAEARAALDEIVDEDVNAELRRLIGLWS